MTGNTTPSLHSFFDSRKSDTKTSHILSNTPRVLVRAGTHVCTLPAFTPNCCQSVSCEAATRRLFCTAVSWRRHNATGGWGGKRCTPLATPPRSCYHYIYIPRCFIGPPCLTSTFTLGLLLLTLTYLTPRCMPVNVLSYFRETWELRERKWSYAV